MNRQNDGRKSMPKLNCPYCGKRFADVPNAQFKNKSQLVTMDKISADDIYYIKCTSKQCVCKTKRFSENQ